jgi:GTP 3',8-cyclase
MKVKGIRFIIGNNCNFKCFYCHQEGLFCKDNIIDEKSYSTRIKKLRDFCLKEKVNDIAITGGEPFMYPKILKIILKTFEDKNFEIVINTNASLIKPHINYLQNYKNIEFHINLSSLDKKTHKEITKGELLKNVFDALELLKSTSHKIKLNIIALKNTNSSELINLFQFAKKNNFIPRILVLYKKDPKFSKYSMSENEIIKIFEGEIIKKHSYGISEIKSNLGNFQIVKCLCENHECERCKRNTFFHLTPDLNIKYCMESEDIVPINYKNAKSIHKSFETANKLLMDIKS